MSKTQLLIHVVFCTKNRKPSINLGRKRDLYSVMFNVCKKNNCWVSRINGMTDHVHLLFDLHPTVALASLIKEIKTDTHKYLKNNPYFPVFDQWGVGYFAASVSPKDKESVIDYIINQQVHHAKGGFMIEIENLIKENGMEWYMDDWM